MYDPISTKQEEKSVCHENVKVEQSSVTRNFRHSMEENCAYQSLKEYANWLDGEDSQPFVTSTSKENQNG